MNRKLIKVYTPESEHGFLGPGHKARSLVRGNFIDTDPFILLMDDMLDKKDYSPVGGAHPHAGFETVSLLVDGEITDVSDTMKKGDFNIMTAGSGIVHTEIINKPTNGRLFQLWLTLPKKDRWTEPRIQFLPSVHTPVSENNGVAIRLYSGSLEGLNSPIQNYVPLHLAEITLQPGVSTILKIPTNFNTFLVALNGSVEIGEDKKLLSKHQVGWLDYSNEKVESHLILKSGDEGARFVLYAAKPTREEIVAHGPFIANTDDDIKRLYKDYRSGKMGHIKNTPKSQQITY